MAMIKHVAAKIVLDYLKKHNIPVDEQEAEDLKQEGFAKICRFTCKIANVIGRKTGSFRVRVWPSWFIKPLEDRSKPILNTGLPVDGIDYQLIPTGKYLFALYYLDLRDYALQLEKDREKWFKRPNWGMNVDQESGTFVWKDGNTKKYPLLVLSSPLDLEIRAKQYKIQDEFRK